MHSNLQVRPPPISQCQSKTPKFSQSKPYSWKSFNKLPPSVSNPDHFLGLTVNDFPLLITSCKQPLDAFSDLYVRCVHYTTYTKNFSDKMELLLP